MEIVIAVVLLFGGLCLLRATRTSAQVIIYGSLPAIDFGEELVSIARWWAYRVHLQGLCPCVFQYERWEDWCFREESIWRSMCIEAGCDLCEHEKLDRPIRLGGVR